jgi:hypothetical protein
MLLLEILGYCRLFHLKLLLSIVNYFTLDHFLAILNNSITTLALGLRLHQGFAKVQAESETWESHFMLPRV